ncbi:hypothetical protein D4764_09G0006110 [Takifugu flavidus]|uniref:Uncharacterized protein n=1 Tax=Takifugu flavidus TaxID=433684 RepID=A0A5C6MKA1_9TELE|nr:hypothetical protein D4764_09G0006110 [Takifugu flavidus]
MKEVHSTAGGIHQQQRQQQQQQQFQIRPHLQLQPGVTDREGNLMSHLPCVISDRLAFSTVDSDVHRGGAVSPWRRAVSSPERMQDVVKHPASTPPPTHHQHHYHHHTGLFQ